MAYEIHIERNSPLMLAEWAAAVTATKGIRLSESGVLATNPDTSEVVRIEGRVGDAEIEVNGEWYPCFRWSELGSASFTPPPNFNEAGSPVQEVARELAKRLSARLVGDEGERYD